MFKQLVESQTREQRILLRQYTSSYLFRLQNALVNNSQHYEIQDHQGFDSVVKYFIQFVFHQ